MTGEYGRIKRKADGRIIALEGKERMCQIVWVEQILVVVDNVRYVHEHFVKAKPFHLSTPRETFKVPV